MSEFRMPSLGADMESGTLIEWLVKPGDQVRRGDIVAVVETDKGAIEVEIFEDALVTELLVPPDTQVSVGTPLARLQKIGEQTSAPGVTMPSPAEAVASSEIEPPATIQPMPTTPAGERRKVSPAARKRAREHGIDLETVVGTGHGGVVTVEDVERAFLDAGAGQSSFSTPVGAPDALPEVTHEARPGSAEATLGMRRTIAAAMSRSKREIPHYYLAHTFDFEPALTWLERRNAERRLTERLLYGALLIKAVASAVSDAPMLNGHWRENGFEASESVNVGVVISLRDGGLVAPAIQDASASSLDSLMSALRDVTQRARSGRLKSSEISSASITVSSLGETGIDTVFPIIHPPQVAIVGFGAVVQRAWAVSGGLHVRRVITATLAADHRASDGHLGAKFLRAVEHRLSRPEEL